MKQRILWVLVIAISFSGFGQKNDIKEIINLVIMNYHEDSVPVYKKFYNYYLLKDFDRIYWKNEYEIFEKYNDTDSLFAYALADSVTVKFNGLKIFKNIYEPILNKMDNSRIRKFTNPKLTRKKRKYAYISYPVISTNRKRALIYVGYYCGGLCGSGGILYLEKINEIWRIVQFDPTWIA